jgi:hypothetical protein
MHHQTAKARVIGYLVGITVFLVVAAWKFLVR